VNLTDLYDAADIEVFLVDGPQAGRVIRVREDRRDIMVPDERVVTLASAALAMTSAHLAPELRTFLYRWNGRIGDDGLREFCYAGGAQ